MQCKLKSTRLDGGIAVQEQEPAHEEAGFLDRVFPRERRYAELGYLLPMFYFEPAVEPGVSALPLGWPAKFRL